MKQKEWKMTCHAAAWDDLSAEEQALVEQARRASEKAYSPYSDFQVGCALQLEDGTVLTGSNQENSSYPCGLCAERTVLNYAHANHPDTAPHTLAIAAQTNGGFTHNPLPPCGICRQTMVELERKFGKSLRLILYGQKESLLIDSASQLMPLQFDAEMLDEGKEKQGFTITSD